MSSGSGGQSQRRPSLPNVINDSVKAALRGQMPTWLPGVVTRYDASTQAVDVQPLVMDVYIDEEETRKTQSFPVVTGCPVLSIGAQSFRITVPIGDGQSAPGTIGILLWGWRSLDKWLSGKGAQVDPELDHHHSLADAAFLPGLLPFGAPLQSAPTDHMTMGHDTGTQLHFHQTLIVAADVESDATLVALGNLVNDRLGTIKTAFNAHKHTGVTTGPGTSGGTDTPIGTLDDVSAQQFKAK